MTGTPVGGLSSEGQIQILLCLYVVLSQHVGLCPPEQRLHIAWVLLQYLHTIPQDLLGDTLCLMFWALQCPKTGKSLSTVSLVVIMMHQTEQRLDGRE